MATYVFTGAAGGNQINSWYGILFTRDQNNAIVFEQLNWTTYSAWPSLNPSAKVEGLFAIDPLSTTNDDVVIGPAGGASAYQVTIGGLDFWGNSAAVHSLSIAAGSSLTLNSNTSLLAISGNIVNDGIVTLHNGPNTGGGFAANGGAGAYLTVGPGDVYLTGSGTVAMAFNAGDASFNGVNFNEITGSSASSASTLHNVDNVISGAGTIGQGGLYYAVSNPANLLILDNQAGGTINANNSASVLRINAAVTNANVMEATAGGTLILADTNILQTGSGAIIADADTSSTVDFRNTTLRGGALKTSGGSITNDGTTVFDGSTSAGSVTISNAYTVGVNTDFALRGAIVNNGVVTLHNGQNISGLGVYIKVGSGDVTLTGGGTVFMAFNAGDANFFGTNFNEITGWSTSSASTLHNVDNVISGAGTIGKGGLYYAAGDPANLLILDNQAGGTINANNTFSALKLQTGQTINNNGLLKAAGGMLVVNDAVTGAGRAIITGGGTAVFSAAFNENVAFQGANAGTFSVAQAYSGVVSGFSVGDAIDLTGLTYAAGEQMVWQSTSNGVQTFALESASNHVLATLNLVGHYASNEFAVVDDGSGRPSVTLAHVPGSSAAPQDFNGDGTSDVQWINPTNQTVGDWLMNSGTPTWQVVGQATAPWKAAGLGDFNGDGTADVLWENPTNGVVGDWLMNNNVPAWRQIGQGSTTMNIAGVGDFNGDGTSDILWQNPTNNYVGIWQMQNNVPTWEGVGYGSTTMNIAGVGDFSGNGKDDILWENPTNNLVGMWAMNGAQANWSLIAQGSTTMNIVGTGDFTGNGTDDILWENPSNGLVGFWGMSNGQATSWNIVSIANTSYQVAGIGDYYGNGIDDILWRNPTTGDTGIWQMNNSQATWHDLGIASTTVNPVKA